MTNIIAQIRAAAAKRALYNRTVFELSNMPADVAHDLGLFPEDAAATARKHVYSS